LKRLALAATCLTGLLMIAGSLDLPGEGDPASPPSVRVSPRYIEDALRETAVPNMVTAVLADYRSFDTLGEVAVIFTAAVAVSLILSGSDRRERPS
jgi:multicomponent Na+:H+ antiporter subunit B